MKQKLQQIRLHNLERLIAEAGSAAELARRANTNSAYLSQLRHQMPTRKGTPRRVGDDLAEKLETGMGKPKGWMDEARVGTPPTRGGDNTPNTAVGPSTLTLHPLIAWSQVGSRHHAAEDDPPVYWEKRLPCPVECSAESFVLRVRGASMEPKFHEGDLIFVDPKVTPAHGHYVIVQLDNLSEATFRQLITEGKRQYLKALNPDWPERIIELDSGASICGVVVFKGEVI